MPKWRRKRSDALRRDVGRRALPVLAAFDQQRVARIGRIVEGAVVAQALARRVAGVDDDVLGHADRVRELQALALPAGERQRRARIGHRMQVEQVVGGVVDRAQLAGAREVGRSGAGRRAPRRSTAG